MPKLLQPALGSVASPHVSSKIQGKDITDTSSIDALSSALGTAGKFALEIQDRNDKVEYHKQLSQFKLDSIKRAEEINKSDIPEGKTLTGLYEEDFEARKQNLKIPRTLSREAQVDLDSYKTDYISNAIQEQSRRGGIRARENWQQIITNNANAVTLNPALAEKSIEEIKRAASALPLDPDTRGALINDGVQSIRSAQAESIINSRPSEFVSQAKAGKWSDINNLAGYLDRADRQIKALDSERRSNLQAQYGQNIDDAIAEASQTGVTSLMPPKEIVLDAYGPVKGQDIYDKYERAISFGQKYSQVKTATPEEISVLLKQSEPQGEGFAQESKEYTELVSAVQQRNKALSDDPANYVQSVYPEIQGLYSKYSETNDTKYLKTAIDQTQEKMEYLGVPSTQRRILPKSQSAAIVEQVNAAKPKQRIETIESIKNTYGDYFNDIYPELVNAGLSDNISVMLRMNDPLQRKAKYMLAEADGAEITKAVDTETKNTIEAELQSELGDYFSSVLAQPGNSPEVGRMMNASSMLAMQYHISGESAASAARKAADDIVNKSYNFYGTTRIPARYDSAAVEEGLNIALSLSTVNQNIEPNIIGSLYGTPPDIQKELYLKELKSGGYFITNPKEDGVYLIDKNGFTVMKKDGDRIIPLEIKFDALENVGKTQTIKQRPSAGLFPAG